MTNDMGAALRLKMELTDHERRILEDMARQQEGRTQEARRARIILLAAEGLSNTEICSTLACAYDTVKAWRSRFGQQRLSGLCRRSHSLYPAGSMR